MDQNMIRLYDSNVNETIANFKLMSHEKVKFNYFDFYFSAACLLTASCGK